MTHPSVAAIVVTYHTGARLKECLYALTSDPGVDRLVIVDNGNPPDLTEWITKFADRRGEVTLIETGENLGFGKAVNLGANATQSDQLLIINPDAVLRNGSLAAMQDTAANLASPWIIGGRIYNLRGEEQRGPRRRELTLWRALTRFVGWNTWTLERAPAPTEPVRMPVISGAFFLTSKKSFDQLGGFDEAYFLHVEDVDLCKRCSDMGGAVMYDPRAGALHYGATSNAPKRVIAKYKADSLAYYFKTHARGPVQSWLVALITPIIRTLTIIRGR